MARCVMLLMAGMFDLSTKTCWTAATSFSWGNGIFNGGSEGPGMVAIVNEVFISCRILWQDARLRLNMRGPNLLHWLIVHVNENL